MREARYRKVLTFALDEDVFERIKKESDEERISIAEYLREIIKYFYTNQRSNDKKGNVYHVNQR